MLGALRRTIGNRFPHVIKKVYQSVIKPSVLYACTVTYPINVVDQYRLERLQCYAAKLSSNNYTQPYVEMLNELKWKSVIRVVCERRAILMYKYVNQLRFLPAGVVILANGVRRSRRFSHSLCVCLPTYVGPNRIRKSFLYVAGNMWNRLNEDYVNLSLILFTKYVKSVNFNDECMDVLNFNRL